MAYVKVPSTKQNLWVDPKAILSLEFFDLDKPKPKKAAASLIIIPDAHKRTPRCQLHLHNMQVVEFELDEGATERTVLDALEAAE